MKLVLINCYFGCLPNYFDLWLESCRKNPNIDFIIFTDDVITKVIPQNVKIYVIKQEDFISKIEESYDFPIRIYSPYKLTDFKPAYGDVFKDLIEPYDYWGYCDIDMLFGDLLKYISTPMENGYEKIYRLGHLTIYKNTDQMRHLYKQKGASFSYKEVFSSPLFYSFDEHAGQMSISKYNSVNEYYQEDMADISCRIHRMTASRHDNYKSQVFYYEDGRVFRAFIIDGFVKTEEFAYIHIQKRKYRKYNGNRNFYYILSDRFQEKKAGIPSAKEIMELSEYEGEDEEQYQLRDFQKRKMGDFIRCSIKEKYIWIRIKMAERRF